jgi:hypothetical protein
LLSENLRKHDVTAHRRGWSLVVMTAGGANRPRYSRLAQWSCAPLLTERMFVRVGRWEPCWSSILGAPSACTRQRAVRLRWPAPTAALFLLVRWRDFHPRFGWVRFPQASLSWVVSKSGDCLRLKSGRGRFESGVTHHRRHVARCDACFGHRICRVRLPGLRPCGVALVSKGDCDSL